MLVLLQRLMWYQNDKTIKGSYWRLEVMKAGGYLSSQNRFSLRDYYLHEKHPITFVSLKKRGDLALYVPSRRKGAQDFYFVDLVYSHLIGDLSTT